MSSIVFDKSIVFALAAIQTVQYLIENHQYVISNQLLKSSTSIGANISEALEAQSRKDFIHKMSIALKESNETRYWLLLLQKSKLINSEHLHLINDAEELFSMLTSIVKTSKAK